MLPAVHAGRGVVTMINRFFYRTKAADDGTLYWTLARTSAHNPRSFKVLRTGAVCTGCFEPLEDHAFSAWRVCGSCNGHAHIRCTSVSMLEVLKSPAQLTRCAVCASTD